MVCVIFLLDFFIRLIYSDRKIRFILYNFPLLLVSIPYLNIIGWLSITVGHQLHLALRTLPLIRGIYGVAIMIGWVTRNQINNLFYSYLITIGSVTYYSSIMFYAVEKGINSQVTNYWDALWWACMDVTTVGSNIYGVTFLGQLLAALLAGAGMMMFPIFTAYITTVYTNKVKAISHKGGSLKDLQQ
ncbi:MAG: two pore domain potassium channel family protein [Rikenellaceae bacterium]